MIKLNRIRQALLETGMIIRPFIEYKRKRYLWKFESVMVKKVEYDNEGQDRFLQGGIIGQIRKNIESFHCK